MNAPNKIQQLIEQFELNIDAYKRGNYNETQVRLEFIDPFFKELGWDVHNELGYAEAFKDVIHEDAIKVGGATKAPDYCFRIGGTRKFFLEAKKPSVNIKGDVHPAYQLRRYAWSAKLPLSILTDFEEFAVYECRKRPAKTDKASTDRILYLTFREYPERWEEIAAIFSKEAVLKGHFDRYVEKGAKRPTSEVDREFLKEIESWREQLAKNIALRNPQLGVRELNYAVQLTIDRIIFLRICEDRGIETYGQLQALCGGPRIYPRLLEIFYRADDKYNSGLFHFREEKGRHSHSDALTPALLLDDKVLKTILSRLYYPECPYEFSVMPAEILGNVYEQFLGKVIRLTAGRQAKIEEKPEVRKAGGVYYTPKYIVDYIVRQTVGKLCEGKTPRQVEKLRILDPACGSGSFLLGAFQYLLNYHRDYYEKEIREGGFQKRHQRQIYQGRGGAWLLTTAEKKRILLSNIYGVDIDEQAVEVTKLSLLLKVLENENQDTLERQLTLWRERALPDLGENIKCGNSLIGSDFYRGQQMNLFDAEEQRRINAFDWEEEFPHIFRAQEKNSPFEGGRGDVGFDAVIGNPPYGIPFNREELKYLVECYPSAAKFPDSYCLFMIKGNSLLRDKGYLSMIVPNTFCDLENCDKFRTWILENTSLDYLWQTGWAFKSAIVDTVVFVLSNKKPEIGHLTQIQIDGLSYDRKMSSFLSNQLSKIDYRNSGKEKEILANVATKGIKLGNVAIVKAGVKLYEKGKGEPPQTKEILKERPYTTKGNRPPNWHILYRGKVIDRYELNVSDEFVNYGPWLAAPRSYEIFKSPKILMRRTDDRIRACIENHNGIAVNSCHVISIKPDYEKTISYPYLLGVLNSKLIQRVFELQNPQMVNKVFAEIKVVYVERFPIRPINFSDPADKARHDQMAQLVETMLDLHKRLQSAALPQEKTRLQRQIAAADRQIDQLVYELYDLTEEEIKIVEDAVK